MRIGRAASTGLTVALLLIGTGCKKEIYHGVTESEANQIVVALADAEIGAEKSAAGGDSKKGLMFNISVEEEYAVAAQRVLINSRLPRERKHGMRDAFETASMIPTEMEEKARYLTALQGDIASTLQQIDNIVDADVHIVMPESNPLEAATDLTTARAAVLVKWQDTKSAASTEDQTKRERDLYFGMLTALNKDLLDIRNVVLRDLKDTSKDEKGPIVALDTYLSQQEPQGSKDVRAKLKQLQAASLKRDGAIARLESLPKVKDLDEVLKQIDKAEESLPFKSASIRALVARSTPRLSEDDVTVEFTKAQPPQPPTKVSVLAGPSWFKQNYMIGLAVVVAVLGVLVAVLGVMLKMAKADLETARKAAAKAAASLGGSLTGGTSA